MASTKIIIHNRQMLVRCGCGSCCTPTTCESVSTPKVDRLVLECFQLSAAGPLKPQLVRIHRQLQNTETQRLVRQKLGDIMRLLEGGFTGFQDEALIVMQIITNLILFDASVTFDQQQTQRVVRSIAADYRSLSQNRPKCGLIVQYFVNNLVVRTANTVFDYELSRSVVIEDEAFLQDAIIANLENHDFLLSLVQLDLCYADHVLECIIDELSLEDATTVFRFSQQFIKMTHRYMATLLELLFPTGLAHLREAQEIEIPLVDGAVSTRLSDGEIEEIVGNAAVGAAINVADNSQYQYLSARNIEFYTRMAELNRARGEVQNSFGGAGDEHGETVHKLAYTIQVVEQYLANEPSAWKAKVICEHFYPQVAFMLTYNFRHQPPDARGRFGYFFGVQVPQLRVSLVKIVAHCVERCPCGWDLIRLFGLLPLVCLCMMGDGQTIGAREVGLLCLKHACDYSPENLEFLRRLQASQ